MLQGLCVFCAGAKISPPGDNTRFKHVSNEMFTMVICSQVFSEGVVGSPCCSCTSSG